MSTITLSLNAYNLYRGRTGIIEATLLHDWMANTREKLYDTVTVMKANRRQGRGQVCECHHVVGVLRVAARVCRAQPHSVFTSTPQHAHITN